MVLLAVLFEFVDTIIVRYNDSYQSQPPSTHENPCLVFWKMIIIGCTTIILLEVFSKVIL